MAPLTTTAHAAEPPAVPGSAVPEALDYTTQTFADPWDFSNRDDLKTDKGPAVKLTSPALSGGQQSFTITGSGYVSPVWGGYPGGLYLDRDGSRSGNRVAADTYTRLSMRVHASKKASVGLMWFTCPGVSRTCEGGMPLPAMQVGWNTYDVLIRNTGYGLPKAWTGAIQGLRLALNDVSGAGTRFTLDWMRLYRPGTSGTVTGAGNSMLVNNGTSTYTLPCDSGTACTRDLSMLPPGTYRFAAPASPDTWSSPVQVVARPRPVVLNPSNAGCGDWATSARAGNRWDFNQATDVKKRRNATGSTTNGIAYGTNASPVMNDPMLHLAMPRAIDGRKWRRITFTMGYDGAFNLADTKGGGTMARVMWQRAESGTNWLQTNDIVTYSGNRTYTVDLGAAGINEPDAPYRYPITSSAKVTALRIDPNEDRGARKWRLYDVRLSYTCSVARGGVFPISFKDNAFTPGSTASVYVVRSTVPRTSGGTLVGTVGQVSGTNTMNWKVPSGLATGSYWVYVVTSNGTNAAGRPASGPLNVT